MLNYYNTGVTAELGDIVASGVDIWAFEYPVPRSEIQYNGKTCKVDFDKATFEKRVIDHYRFRQIGQETVGRWLHYFRTRINEIMPYYVQVYELDAKFRNIEDPLESYNLIEEFKQNTKGNGTVTGSTSEDSSGTTGGTTNRSLTSNKLNKFSDTPQGSSDHLDAGYLTNVTKDDQTDTETGGSSGTSSGHSSGTHSSTTNDNGETTHTLTRKGNIGVQPLGGEVLNIRSALINIDLQIIEELNDLFLKIY